jgi:hypothetical protein
VKPPAAGAFWRLEFGEEPDIFAAMQDPIGVDTAGGFKPGSDLLATERVNTTTKVFFFDLKENQRGRFVKITEDSNGRRNTVMVPIEALRDCALALAKLMDWDEKSRAELVGSLESA